MAKLIRFKSRNEFLIHIYNKKKITKLDDIIKEVIHAEKIGTLVVKGNVNKSYETYVKNVRWYMGELERSGQIKGFLTKIGRPAKQAS